MGSNNRALGILGSVVVGVIVLAGWGLKALLGDRKPQPQSMEELARQAQAQAQAQSQVRMPDLAKLARG